MLFCFVHAFFFLSLQPMLKLFWLCWSWVLSSSLREKTLHLFCQSFLQHPTQWRQEHLLPSEVTSRQESTNIIISIFSLEWWGQVLNNLPYLATCVCQPEYLADILSLDFFFLRKHRIAQESHLSGFGSLYNNILH